MDRLLDSRLFRAGIWLLLLFLVIYAGGKVSYIFIPLVVIVETLFFPILISGILYYMTYPLVDWLHGKKIPRWLAIFIVYILIIGILSLIAVTIFPVIQEEVRKLQEDIPAMIGEVEEILMDLEERGVLPYLEYREDLNIENLARQFTGTIQEYSGQIIDSIGAVIDFFTHLFTILVMVPFLLFFMLKEKGSPVINNVLTRFVPQNHLPKIHRALSELNKAMSSYVQGIGIVCLSVGILVYIGYSIIGLNYSLILALFAMITNIIPFLGPFIGAIPGVIVGALDSPLMMLKVIAVIVVAQQLESLFISPQVMGRKLHMNPLTIIILVMVAGRMGGFLGIILAVPTFTILKIIASHVYDFIVNRREEEENNFNHYHDMRNNKK